MKLHVHISAFSLSYDSVQVYENLRKYVREDAIVSINHNFLSLSLHGKAYEHKYSNRFQAWMNEYYRAGQGHRAHLPHTWFVIDVPDEFLRETKKNPNAFAELPFDVQTFVKASVKELVDGHKGWAGVYNSGTMHYFGAHGYTLCERYISGGKKSYMPWEVVDKHCKVCRKKYEDELIDRHYSGKVLTTLA